jgi:hypothetical protein
VSKKKPCSRCENGIEPSWDTDGWAKNAFIVKSITIAMSYIGLGIRARNVPLIANEELILCSNCWFDFDEFMREYKNKGITDKSKDELRTVTISIDV